MAVNNQDINDRWAIYNGDCIEVMEGIPDNSIHLSVYSPPFGGLYTYSSNDRDLSNNIDYDGFMEHYGYCVTAINRITMPGRITAVHCSEVPSSNCGKDSLNDLPGDIIRLHVECGFVFIGRVNIWKEPLWVRNRTMVKNLFHKTICEDAAYCGIASGDYILFFRKAGDNPVPIAHPTGLMDYAGEAPIPIEVRNYRGYQGDQIKNAYSQWIWRQYASCVWDDIRMGYVLPYKDCKEEDDEKHVHPLQLDVIDRIVTLRSNPGEVVFTPFMGVGSEVYSAVANGRKGMGIELKTSYYRQAAANLASIDVEKINANAEQLPFGESDGIG